MKLGIKVYPQKESLNDLLTVRPSMAEVWFDPNQIDKYSELFDALKKQNMEVGLHFWAVLPDGTWTNLAYPDTALVNGTIDLMKKTIDIAAANKFQYVNVHPGSAAKLSLDLAKGQARIKSEPARLTQSIAVFLENAKTLNQYALKNNIVLTFETVPIRDADDWKDPESRNSQERILNLYELPVEALIKAANENLWIANDFGHTGANVISDNPADVWKLLHETTQTLAPQTKLIHLNYTIPPFNGTDIHDMLDNPLMDTNEAVPNNKQMVELLNIFKARDDVWVLNEPKRDHVRNYFLAKKLLKRALKI